MDHEVHSLEKRYEHLNKEDLNEKTIENFLIFKNDKEKELYFLKGEMRGNLKAQADLSDLFLEGTGEYDQAEMALTKLW